MRSSFVWIRTVLLFIVVTVPLCVGAVSFNQHTITTGYAGPWSVYAMDIDGDDDVDIVSAGRFTNSVNWWENDGDQSFVMHTVSNDVVYPMGVHADDYDGDGDMDVVCAADVSEEIVWFENDGEQNFTKHQIGQWPGAVYVWGGDVDGDGHPDVLAAACEGVPGLFGWFQNDGAGNFTEHMVMGDWDHANCIHSADVDSDGDIDFLGSASWAGDIMWFENDGDQNFAPHTILDTTFRPSSVHGVDVDGDGDTDVLATVCGINRVLWFENDGTQQFTEHTIATGFLRPHCVWSADLDNDDDVDILGAAINSNEISWWENDGSQGFTKHTLSQDFLGATDVYVEDVDHDGDKDVLGAAQFGNQLAWWENNLYGFSFVGEPTSGHAPLTVQFTDLSATDPPLTYRAWDFDNDGAVDSEEIDPSWTYESPGTYTVSLEVGNESMSETIVYEGYIRVFDGESAIELDGNAGSCICDATPMLNLTEELTLEAWIKPSGWGEVPDAGYGRIVDKESFALYLVGESVSYNTQSLAFLIKNTTGAPVVSCSPVGSIALNEWRHVAATYDAASGNVTLLIDGTSQELSQTSSPSGSIRDNLESDLCIGNSTGGIYTFDGIIDEVRVWDVARSSSEIEETMAVPLDSTAVGLVACWRMNEGGGLVLHDGSGYGHDAVLSDVRWAQGVHLVLSEDDPQTSVIPSRLVFQSSYPNPFTEGTTLRFQIPEQAICRISIHDIRGNRVCLLTEKPFNAGSHTVCWNGMNRMGQPVPSGVYFCKVEGASYSSSGPLVLAR